MMKEAFRQSPHVLNSLKYGDWAPLCSMFLSSQFQTPGGVHYGMFIVCLKMLSSDEMYE